MINMPYLVLLHKTPDQKNTYSRIVLNYHIKLRVERNNLRSSLTNKSEDKQEGSSIVSDATL